MVGSLMISSTESKTQSVEHEESVKESSPFNRRIEFHPARKPFSGFSNGTGDFQLETLNPSSDHKRPGASPGQPGMGGKKTDGSESWENGLDQELSFQITFRRIGAGLQNLGNTCFLNSVLQCLTYTEPLAAYLQSGKLHTSCHIAGFCALCAIQKHVSRALQATGRILAPKDLVSNLRCISRNFRNARQEDAHEYMVNLLESMHKCCLPSGVPSESPSAYEKSLVHRIFGGRLRSQVKCMQCSYCSDTFDPFLDLSLEIIKADSLQKALVNFTTAELLDGGERQYQCQRCKQKVRALKQLTVHKPPSVLTIHLKRFRAHDPGQKIDKKVQFGPTLDMKPFVSGSYEGDLKYTLYGVLVHYGWSTHSGHYYCFVRTSSGMWYSLDDNRVVQVNERTVLDQKAYMLFYVRDRRSTTPRKSIDAVQKENLKANVAHGNGTCSISNQSQRQTKENGLHCAHASTVTNVESLKGKLMKEKQLQHDNGHMSRKSIVTNVLETSSSVPTERDPPVGPSSSNQNLGQCLPSSTLSVASSSDALNLQKSTLTTRTNIDDRKESNISIKDPRLSVTTSTKCSSVLNSITDEINSVSKAGVMTTAASDGVGNCKTLERDSSIAPSGDSSNKTLDKNGPLALPSKLNCQISQVGGTANDSVSGSSLNEKTGNSVQITEADLVKSTAQSVTTSDSLSMKAPDGVSDRKSKKKLLKGRVNMHIGLKFFRTSLGLRKKKHKKKSCHILDTQNLKKEHLMEEDGSSSDMGPSTSERSGTTSLSSTRSKKKVAHHISAKSVRHCNGDPLMDVIGGEYRDKVVKNSAALAGEERLQSSSNSSLEANQQDVGERDGSKDTKISLSQNGMMSMLTRGLEETTVERWDEVDLPRITEPNGTESLSIGYVPDEWDEEYDRGKRKKLRQSKHSFGGPNPFQEIATKRTTPHLNKKPRVDVGRSGNQPFRI